MRGGSNPDYFFEGERAVKNVTGERTETGSARITLGLLPVLALSTALTTPVAAQSVNVPLDPVTVQGGGASSSSQSSSEEAYTGGDAEPATGDGSLRSGIEGYNVGQSSSTKSTAPLLNTPQTVTVVPGTIIQERQVTTLVETLRNTPGITFDAGENGFSAGPNQFNIRGFNSVGSVFVDGTRDNGNFMRDVYNIEGVEIVKGAAADNGRGTAGGYVNTVTKTPRIGNFVAGSVGIGFDQYDSEMRRRAALDVNQSFGTVGVRLNTMIQDGGVAGRDVTEANAWGVAPSLAFGLGTNFRTTIAYERYERNDLPDAGVAINRSVAQRGVGIKGAGLRPYLPANSRDTFFGRTTDYDDVQSDSVLARFEYDMVPGVTISNQTRWAQVDREAVLSQHPATPTNPMGAFSYSRINNTLSNQTNVTAKFSTGFLKHTLSTGVDLSREKSKTGNIGEARNVAIDTVALYAYDTIELSRQWQITGGLRLEHYDVDLAGAGIPGSATGTYSDSKTLLGGKVGVVYKPVEQGSLYASYGVSHLPHGSLLSNPDITRGAANGFPGFLSGAKTVELHNYEVGVKWDWFGGKLSTTAAAFYTEKQDALHGNATNLLYEDQSVRGIEIGVAGNLTERWKVFGGATLLDSERHHSNAVDAWARTQGSGGGVPGDYGCSAPVANCTITTDGDSLAFTPNFFANLWMTYDVTDRFTVGGGIQYVGDAWIGRPDDALRIIKNGLYGKTPDYFLVNLMTSYKLTDNINLQLNVDNVFNETYLTTMNWNGNWGYLGAPRTYWLSANFKY